jgi:hypothetical protein
VALDPEHRLVVSVVPGKRTVENVEALVQDFKERTEGRPERPEDPQDLLLLEGLGHP